MAPEVAKGTFLLVSTPTRPGAPELLRILALSLALRALDPSSSSVTQLGVCVEQ